MVWQPPMAGTISDAVFVTGGDQEEASMVVPNSYRRREQLGVAVEDDDSADVDFGQQQQHRNSVIALKQKENIEVRGAAAYAFKSAQASTSQTKLAMASLRRL